MKTIKSIFLTLIIVIAVNFCYAGKSGLNIISMEGKKAYVAISNEDPSRFEISIINARGEIVYYKWVSRKTTEYRKVFDFSKLNKGVYTIKVKSKGILVEKELNISENDAIVAFNNESGEMQ